MSVADEVLTVIFALESLAALLFHLGWFRERILIGEAARTSSATESQQALAKVFVHVEFFRFAMNLILFLVALGIVTHHAQALYLLLLLPLASISATAQWRPFLRRK